MFGSATATIETSIPSRKRTPQRSSRRPQRRESNRVAGEVCVACSIATSQTVRRAVLVRRLVYAYACNVSTSYVQATFAIMRQRRGQGEVRRDARQDSPDRPSSRSVE